MKCKTCGNEQERKQCDDCLRLELWRDVAVTHPSMVRCPKCGESQRAPMGAHLMLDKPFTTHCRNPRCRLPFTVTATITWTSPPVEEKP